MKKWMFISIILLTLTGCWDRDEIEEEAFVVAIGLDESESGKGLLITYQIANPQSGIPNTGGRKEKSSVVTTFNAPNFLTARDLSNAYIARKINFSHAKTIVISEALAQKKEGYKYLTAGLRDSGIRRDIKLIVSREKASEFINNNNPMLETRPHKFYDLIAGRWKETGLVPFSNMMKFIQKFEKKEDGFLAIYASTKQYKENTEGNEDDYLPGEINRQGGANPAELIGSAVFKNGLMVGSLTGEETRMAMILRQRTETKFMRSTYLDPVNPEYRVAAKLNKHVSTKVRVHTKKDPLVIDVHIPLHFEIHGIPSGVNYVTNKENQELLRKEIKTDLEEKFYTLIKKSQEEFKVNLFNWSHVARKKFLTLPEYKAFNLSEKYTEAEVNVNVEVTFSGFGMKMDPHTYQDAQEQGV